MNLTKAHTHNSHIRSNVRLGENSVDFSIGTQIIYIYKCKSEEECVSVCFFVLSIIMAIHLFIAFPRLRTDKAKPSSKTISRYIYIFIGFMKWPNKGKCPHSFYYFVHIFIDQN